jgi:hypothetical protein
MQDSKPEYPSIYLAYCLAQEVLEEFKDDSTWTNLVSQAGEKYICLGELIVDEKLILELLEDFFDGVIVLNTS